MDQREPNQISELELIKQRMNERTDESLDSTRRMVGLCEESKNVGSTTLENLYYQGEKIDRMGTQVDHIHADLAQTEKALDDLEKCCGLCLPIGRRVKRPRNKVYVKTQKPEHVNSSGVKGKDSRHARKQQTEESPGYIMRITNDAREDEMEENLGQVASAIGELHTMAADIGNETAIQTQKLDIVSEKVVDSRMHLYGAQKQAERIVGKPTKVDTRESFIPTPGVGSISKHIVSQVFK